jgi:hypothetical protein
LEAALSAAGKTKAGLAKFLNVSQSLVPGWGREHSHPTLSQLVNTGVFLGVRAGWLAFGEELVENESPIDPRVAKLWGLLNAQQKACILFTMSTFCGFMAPSVAPDDPRLREILKLAELI